MAPTIYWSVLIVIVLAVITGGATDFTLWLLGRQTISAYLRLHPDYFLWPLAATLFFLGLLSLHLFVLWK